MATRIQICTDIQMNSQVAKADFVYSDLSYRIIGVLFEVWNNVGVGHKEKFYQKAVANELGISKIQFREQLPVKLEYKGKSLGIYYFDFMIEDKVVLEIKIRNHFSKKDIEQLYSYLKAKNLKLGIIAHFTKSGVRVKRVVNIT